jgi:hypothetical protein
VKKGLLLSLATSTPSNGEKNLHKKNDNLRHTEPESVRKTEAPKRAPPFTIGLQYILDTITPQGTADYSSIPYIMVEGLFLNYFRILYIIIHIHTI